MKPRKLRSLFILLFFLLSNPALSQENTVEYRLEKDILYRGMDDTTNEYIQDRCKLDIYFPLSEKNFATIVWFHGGGIKAGNKFIPKELKEKGMAVVAANYRLHPKVQAPTYIEDAAAAVAWTFKHIKTYGGDPSKIFVSGHSAGGYLASMVGLDSTYLAPYAIHPNEIAGLIPYSGHTITHFTIRTERGIPGTQAIVDKFAPLYHVRKDAPPMVLITGDRELELLGRYEETAYFARMMKIVGHTETVLYELGGYNHGQMAVPAHPLLLKHVKMILEKSEKP